MQSERPVNLSVISLLFSMPIAAVASILHRATGVVLFVGVMYLFYLLSLALGSARGFADVAHHLDSVPGKLAVWLVVASLCYHLLAGIRHLLMDFHWGDTRIAGRVSAWATMVLAMVLAVVLGAWIW